MDVPDIRYGRSVGDVDIAYCVEHFGGTHELQGVPDSWQLDAAVS